MSLFHVTMTQGRSDTFYVECSSSPILKNVLNEISTANVDNIKEIVLSENFKINDLPSYEFDDFYFELNVFCSSKNYSKIIKLPYIKKNLSNEFIIKSIKRNVLINDEPIINVVCLNRVEGLPDALEVD